jgi:prevent-host-death family protein
VASMHRVARSGRWPMWIEVAESGGIFGHMAQRKIDIEPISALKRASEVAAHVRESKRPLYVTQNGRASIVIQDVESFERREEAVAFLKLCLQGLRDIEEGRSKSPARARRSLRARARRRARELGIE